MKLTLYNKQIIIVAVRDEVSKIVLNLGTNNLLIFIEVRTDAIVVIAIDNKYKLKKEKMRINNPATDKENKISKIALLKFNLLICSLIDSVFSDLLYKIYRNLFISSSLQPFSIRL